LRRTAPVGQAARALVSADTHHNSLFGKKGEVLNLSHLYFDIVSYFARLRHLYICRETFTNVMSALQIHLFMQNKANFKKGQMNVSDLLTMNYEQRTMNYEIKNKPNSNPIQTQYKANSKPIQTQYEPNSNPNKPNFRLYLYLCIGCV
jgi:hypothetical protein